MATGAKAMRAKYKDKEWLHQQYRVEGRSGPDIAAELGCSYGTIYHWLNKHGISRQYNRKHYDNGSKQRNNVIIRLYQQGVGPTIIGNAFGISRQRIDQIVHNLRARARKKAQDAYAGESHDCEACGTPNAEMHHDDYSSPLEVRWLCTECHKAVHRGETRMERNSGEPRSVYLYNDEWRIIDHKARQIGATNLNREPNTSAGLRALIAEFKRLRDNGKGE